MSYDFKDDHPETVGYAVEWRISYAEGGWGPWKWCDGLFATTTLVSSFPHPHPYPVAKELLHHQYNHLDALVRAGGLRRRFEVRMARVQVQVARNARAGGKGEDQ